MKHPIINQILTEWAYRVHDGMPNLKRTEPSLSKQRDNLWKGAKETLIGTRGVNEDY